MLSIARTTTTLLCKHLTLFVCLQSRHAIPGAERARRDHRSQSKFAQIYALLKKLDIKINSTLTKLIKATPESVILKAIAALEEALSTTSVRNRCGFLVEAIKNTWMPNVEHQEKLDLDCFNQWYELAKPLGLAIASIRADNIIYIITPQQQWFPFDVMLSDYPLEKLTQMRQTSLQCRSW